MQPTRTKIVATVGPASGTAAAIGQLVEAGVDVFRLNFSHGDHDAHAGYIRAIREAAAGAGVAVAVMQDLQGPRIRTGALRDGRPVELKPGAQVTLRPGDFAGDGATIAVSYGSLARDLRPGDKVLLDDGLIELNVIACDENDVTCDVGVGGLLRQRKGVNLPGVKLSIAAPTEKDIADLRFGVEQGVDYVALSFVQTADDLRRLKEELAQLGAEAADTPVIAKIERPDAVEQLNEILEVADGVMVARGDLGIEMPPEKVPALQKQIIHAANRRGLPVITATQMLESMVASPRPTRAEASDVANAILDGTDAVMLSAETSIGRYPVAAVRMMDRIAQEAEGLRRREQSHRPPDLHAGGEGLQVALAEAACDIARRLGAAGIVPFTLTGSTARYISQRRPDAPIYALTPDERAYRRLALLWGVCPVMLDVFETTDQMIERAGECLLALGLASAGDTVVYVAGASTHTPGGSDMLKIHRF